MSNIKKSIKNPIQKLWKKYIDKDDKLTNTEQLAFDIFKISLSDSNNIRYLSPNYSDKKYILTKSYLVDENVDTFITLSGNNLTIVNHEYRYDISLPEKTSVIMSNMFDDQVEKEREKMEEKILNNITNSLDIVLNNFKENLIAKE